MKDEIPYPPTEEFDFLMHYIVKVDLKYPLDIDDRDDD